MSLQSDIKDVFTEDMTDDDFAGGIADAINTFVGGCSFTVTPTPLVGSDTSPTGAFTGKATVSWKINKSTIKSTILAVCTPSMTDAQLASAIASALDAAAPQWTASYSGNTTTTSSPPVTSPASDNAVVTSTFVSATVKSGLVSCFNAMKNMQQGGDDYMAAQMASLISAYYTGSVNTIKGATHLSGVTGSVKVVALS